MQGETCLSLYTLETECFCRWPLNRSLPGCLMRTMCCHHVCAQAAVFVDSVCHPPALVLNAVRWSVWQVQALSGLKGWSRGQILQPDRDDWSRAAAADWCKNTPETHFSIISLKAYGGRHKYMSVEFIQFFQLFKLYRPPLRLSSEAGTPDIN